jgi:hypothetical protein
MSTHRMKEHSKHIEVCIEYECFNPFRKDTDDIYNTDLQAALLELLSQSNNICNQGFYFKP